MLEQLYDFARMGSSRELGPIVGNSGTASRAMNPMDPTEYVYGLLGGTYLNPGHPQVCVPLAAGGRAKAIEDDAPLGP